MDYNIYKIVSEDTERLAISIVPLEKGFDAGLPEKSIIGFLKNQNVNVIPDNIFINEVFVVFFHSVIKKTAVNSSKLKETALKQKHGFIYIIDLRDKNYPNTKREDILGAFILNQGEIILESYTPNPFYQLISTDGIFKLPKEYEESILKYVYEEI